MKTHKMDLTRPMFLKKFLTDSDRSEDITEEDLERMIPGKSKLVHAAYTVLLEQDLKPSDIRYVNCDEDSVVIKLASKDLVKRVRDSWHKETMRLGAYFYKIKVKTKDAYAYISIEQGHAVGEE